MIASVTWWDQLGAVGSGGATVAVAVFAIVQVVRERTRRRNREQTAIAQISATGYLLRRQLLGWIGSRPDTHDHLESWMREARRTQSYSSEVRIARNRLRKMMSHIGDAPMGLSDSVRRAYVYFLEGTRRLDAHVTQSRPRGTAVLDWIQLRSDAHADLRDCLSELDEHIIEIRLLNTETILTRKRDDEEPFHHLGVELQKRKWQAS